MSFKNTIERVRSSMKIEHDQPELMKAQYRALCKQIPALYLVLLINSWGLVSSHTDAPMLLTGYIPSFLTLVCVARIVTWWRDRKEEVEPDVIRVAFHRLNILTIILGASFTAWALALYPYGNTYAQSHIAFFMSITLVSCIFCLTHLRSAAFVIAVMVTSAIVVFFSWTGNTTFIATGINVGLVTVVMLAMVSIYNRDFKQLIAAQVETLALSHENFCLANVDALTGLPNRRDFFMQLDSAIEQADVAQQKLGLGIIDLDGFKPVNDLYGHAVGDALLVLVAARIQSVCSGYVARLGGDEFGIIFSEPTSQDELLDIGQAICGALHDPFIIDDKIVHIGASMGIAVYPTLAMDRQVLFDRADYALYHVKNSDAGRALLFSDEHSAAISENTKVEQALLSADLAQELKVYFQPIVDIRTNAVVAFEALARWQSPQLGFVSPNMFIPAAERIGAINALTHVLLANALAVASKWPPHIRLSFNLSTRDVSSAECVFGLMAIVLKSGLDPQRIDFEITETSIMNDFERSRAAVETLRRFGCGISLDDFGTGFSSLRQLHALPLTKIKVDRSFVSDLHRRPASYKIVKSLIALSSDMGLECVIEGAETEDEMVALRKIGCALVQGYYFARPMPDDDLKFDFSKPVSERSVA